jgi:Arc/MetJ-type ribon-helix-helix transcriptional regulator
METTISTRIDDADRDEIEALVKKGLYVSPAHFLREAIKEKLHPEYKKERLKLQMAELARYPEVWEEAGIKYPGPKDQKPPE